VRQGSRHCTIARLSSGRLRSHNRYWSKIAIRVRGLEHGLRERGRGETVVVFTHGFVMCLLLWFPQHTATRLPVRKWRNSMISSGAFPCRIALSSEVRPMGTGVFGYRRMPPSVTFPSICGPKDAAWEAALLSRKTSPNAACTPKSAISLRSRAPGSIAGGV
jgi:hypothetical protein